MSRKQPGKMSILQRKRRGKNTPIFISRRAILVQQLLLTSFLHLHSSPRCMTTAERVEDHRHQQLHGGQLHQTTLEIVADAGVKTSTTSVGLDKDFRSQQEVLEASSSRPRTPGPHGKSSAAVPSSRMSHTRTTKKTMSKKQAAVVPRGTSAAATPGHEEEHEEGTTSHHQNVGGRQQASDDGRHSKKNEVGDVEQPQQVEPALHRHQLAGAAGTRRQHEQEHAVQSATSTMRRENKPNSESKTPADEELLEISTRPVHHLQSRDKDDEVQALHQAEVPRLQKNSTAAKENSTGLEGVQDDALHAHSSRSAKRAPQLMTSERNRVTLVQRAEQALSDESKAKQRASADEVDITPTDVGSATASSDFGNPANDNWYNPSRVIDDALDNVFATANDNAGTAQVCAWVQIDLGKEMAVSEVKYTFKKVTSHTRRIFFETVWGGDADIQYEGGKDTATDSNGAEVGGADKGFRIAVSSRKRVNTDTCEVQNTSDWDDGWCKGKAVGEECPTTAEETCELVLYGAGGEGLARFTQETDHTDFATATINCNGKVGQYVILEWPGGTGGDSSKTRMGFVSELRVFGAEYTEPPTTESPEKEGDAASKTGAADESATTTRITRPSLIFLAATTMVMLLATNFCAVWFGL
ncbi:unnamed protein product [Amoebophrya sp. A120]|nr:unnamed protein product [Amoebophrya sp. A120]|eukprot:GSA120T00017012001.1